MLIKLNCLMLDLGTFTVSKKHTFWLWPPNIRSKIFYWSDNGFPSSHKGGAQLEITISL